jgi:hypothetical protein
VLNQRMRNRVGGAIALVALAIALDVAPVGAQLLPTTTTTAPTETTVTTAPVETTTTVTTAPETTTTATTAPAETTTTGARPTTTATTGTTAPGFVPPAGVTSTTAPERDEVLEADTGKLPLFIALSLGGFAIAITIVTVQWVRTRPRGPAVT